jgi:(5-formylfuran-3-yl)methyl phosphate synthase
MRLLVSVRSAAEVNAAVSGGADIIDAKEPEHGPLGRVSPKRFRDILEQVPTHVELSAALGDFTETEEVYAAVSGIPEVFRPTVPYLKLGFAGVSSTRQIGELLEAASRAARRRRPPAAAIIAVAYGDYDRTGTVTPEEICHAAAVAGAAGILLDTQVKGDTHLLDWVDPARLKALLASAGAAGLVTAVAGGLGVEQLPEVRRCLPDIVGFRGAVCAGGRSGVVRRSKVARLSHLLTAEFSLCSGGETT